MAYIKTLEEYKACRDCIVKNHTVCDVEELVYNMHEYAQHKKSEAMNADFTGCKIKEMSYRLAKSVHENGLLLSIGKTRNNR